MLGGSLEEQQRKLRSTGLQGIQQVNELTGIFNWVGLCDYKMASNFGFGAVLAVGWNLAASSTIIKKERLKVFRF